MNPVSDIQKQQIFFRPFIPLLIALICGILAGEAWPDFGQWVFFAALLNSLWMIACIRQKRSALLPPLLLFFCLGWLSMPHWMNPSLPEDDISRHAGQNHKNICGTVRTIPVIQGNRQTFFLDAESLGTGNKKVSGRMRVSGPSDDIIPAVGDRIRFSGKIRAIRNFGNPGGFDYERHMVFQSVRSSVYARKSTLSLIGHKAEDRFRLSLEKFRSTIAHMIRENSSGDAQAVLPALIIGDKSGISSRLRDEFARSGIAHLLAISGLHMGMIAFVSFFIFRWIGYRIPRLPPSDAVRNGAAFLSLFPLLAYGMISGMSPATQRAMIMIFICITAFVLHYEQDGLNTLALAALLILIIHPPTLFSISFQLSFAAVLCIISGFSGNFGLKISPESGFRGRLLHYLLSCLKSSLLAILGTLPLTMYYFNQLSFTGLFANLIFIPLIGFLVLPAGLLAVFLSLFSPDMAADTMELCAFFLSFSLKFLPLFSDIPLTAMKTFTPCIPEILLFYLLLRSLGEMMRSPEGKLRKYAFPVLIVTLLAFAADAAYWFHMRFGHKNLKITVMDVGQGSAALVEFPRGKTMLIDGGGFYDNSSFDVGAAVVAPFLWRKRIMTLDYMLLSHPESDHMNGLMYIAENFTVKEIRTTGIANSGANYRHFMEIIRSRKIPFPDFTDLPRTEEISGATVDILWPPHIENMEKQYLQKLNNTSLCLRLSFAQNSILFPGDIEIIAEKELLKTKMEKLGSTVLLAPHHGCATSNSEEFIRQVQPEILITSSGWQNRYNCPSPEVIRRYREYGCRIFRTDMQGAVSLSFQNDGEIQIRTGRNESLWKKNMD